MSEEQTLPSPSSFKSYFKQLLVLHFQVRWAASFSNCSPRIQKSRMTLLILLLKVNLSPKQQANLTLPNRFEWSAASQIWTIQSAA